MALTLGTNCGFVTVAPTTDPEAGGYLTTDGYSRGMLDTTPSGTVIITEIGFFKSRGTVSGTYDIGLYSDAGNGEPENRIFVEAGQSMGATVNQWQVVDGLNWELDPETNYWLCVQIDNTDTTSIDYSTGSKTAALTSQTSLISDWGTSDYTSADRVLSIYALVQQPVGDVSSYRNGSNTTSTTVAVTLPEYDEGDLIITCIDYWEDNNQANDLTWAAGPDGETVTSLETQYGYNTGDIDNDLPLIALGWYIATDAYAGGTWNQTADIATRYGVAVIRIKDGVFNASNPLSTAVGKDYDTDDTDPVVPAFSATSSDGDGYLFNFIAVDQDPFVSEASGYTILEEEDYGRASMMLTQRDTDVTASESIGTATYDIGGDAWCAYGFIVRMPSTSPSIQINIGDSWKDCAGMQINIGDTWKTVASVQINIGDTWKDVS